MASRDQAPTLTSRLASSKKTEIVRVRIASDELAVLDSVIAQLKGLGHENITRSSLIRGAIDEFVEGLVAENPTLAVELDRHS
jgi:hypothetical protein